MLRRRSDPAAPLELTTSDMRRPEQGARVRDGQGLPEAAARRELADEIDRLARYVARFKREVATLRPGEACRDTLPAAQDDLRQVGDATTQAVNRIMAAAETLLELGSRPESRETAGFETRVLEIMEACTFQDLAGQRLARALSTLAQLERRLGRMVSALGVADAVDAIDPQAILREARREILLVEGPQNAQGSIEQDAVDKLFD